MLFEGNLEDKQGFKRWRAGPWALGPGPWRTHFRQKGWHSGPHVRKEGGVWVPGTCPLVSSRGGKRLGPQLIMR